MMNSIEMDFMGGKERKDLRLLSGEKIAYSEEKVSYLSPYSKITPVDITVTNYRIVFVNPEKTFEIVLGKILSIEKIGKVQKDSDQYGILIKTKDNQEIRLLFSPVNHSRRNMYDRLRKASFCVYENEKFFAFAHFGDKKKVNKGVNGWNVYNPLQEYKRMNIPSANWDISTANNNYELTDTYPTVLVLPKAAIELGTAFIKKVAEFRSRKRLAVLSWLHPHFGSSITRCAQPLTGITYRKSPEDEMLLYHLFIFIKNDAMLKGHVVQ